MPDWSWEYQRNAGYECIAANRGVGRTLLLDGLGIQMSIRGGRVGLEHMGAEIVSSCIFVMAARCVSEQMMPRIWRGFFKVEW